MNEDILSRKAVVTGLVLLAIGIAAGIGAVTYEPGTVNRMGPGFFPLLLSALLILVGAIQLVSGLVKSDEGAERIDWTAFFAGFRPLFFTVLGLIQFALTINVIGLPLATSILVILSSLGQRGFNLVSLILTAFFCSLGTYIIFGYLLGLPMKMWP